MNPTALKSRLPIIALACALLAYFVINPPRLEHLALIGLFVALLYATDATRDLAVSLLPAGLFALTYDLLGLFAERSYSEVIVEPVYRAEAALFGWLAPEAGALGPVDYFVDHHHLSLDVMAGLLYSTHVPAALLFGVYLWWRCRQDNSEEGDRRVHPFMWGYLLMNLIGFGIWICFPVAPPWYVEQYGFAPPSGPIPGDPAALERVDLLLGYEHFESIYEQATYVFGAFPSMHVAPGVWIALWACRPSMRVLAVAYACLMSFFAVYLNHHYIIDVLAGALLAAAVYWLMSRPRAEAWSIRLAEALRRAVDGVKTQGRES